MSQFNAIGEYGLNDLLGKRLTTPGGSDSPSVAPEIFPCLTLESDRPEWSWLKGELLSARYVFLAAVAAQYGMVQFYLPTNARTVAVITSITTQTANQLRIARLVGISGGLGGWTGLVTANRDTGARGEGGSMLVESTSNVAQPSAFITMAQLDAVGQRYDSPIVVRPGGSICIFTNALNVTIGSNVTWYERPAQPGELA